jgi:hypothetical protein
MSVSTLSKTHSRTAGVRKEYALSVHGAFSRTTLVCSVKVYYVVHECGVERAGGRQALDERQAASDLAAPP